MSGIITGLILGIAYYGLKEYLSRKGKFPETDNKTTDWVSLQNWYKNKARNQAILQKIGLSFSILLFVLINIGSVNVIIGYLDEKKEERFMIEQYENSQLIGGFPGESRESRDMAYEKIYKTENGVTVFYIIVILSFLLITPFIFSRIRNRLKNTSYKKLDRNSFKGIWELTDDLTHKMQIKKNVEIYFLQINSFEAHVSKSKSCIKLYLSRSLISFYSQDKEKFKAIIAHEFGHVLQNDTLLLLIGVKSLRTISNLSVVGCILGFLTGSDTKIVFLYYLLSLVYYKGFKVMRHRAEYLADVASACYLGNRVIIDVLNLSDAKTDPYYPSKEERIEYINNSVNRFGVIKNTENNSI